MAGSKRDTVALIVAGGNGSRYSSSIPKQYTDSILRNTILKFYKNKNINAIQVVIREEDIELYQSAVHGLNVLPFVIGGTTRAESVKNGLLALEKYNPDLLLIHDANRPYITDELINKVIKELEQNPNSCVIPAIRIHDTVKRINTTKVEIIDRENLFIIQTPQGFHHKQLSNIGTSTPYTFTDESSLAEQLGIEVKYIQGDKENIKITFKEDKKMDRTIRTGIGFDAHKFTQNVSENHFIILGGVNIPHTKKLEAHSDGDVLIHAIVDAILGSISAGDIGMYFPPSDNRWKNANSKIFLEYCKNLLNEKNATINNIDATVICEKPNLSKYKEQISMNIASILDLNFNQVCIKATTTEKMGFTGREEGIAVQAIVTISIII